MFNVNSILIYKYETDGFVYVFTLLRNEAKILFRFLRFLDRMQDNLKPEIITLYFQIFYRYFNKNNDTNARLSTAQEPQK